MGGGKLKTHNSKLNTRRKGGSEQSAELFEDPGLEGRKRARVIVFGVRVEGGTGEGNQNDLTLHFGLGSYENRAELEVRWPDGVTTNVTTPTNRSIVIRRNYLRGDLNSNGVMNLEDFTILADKWGKKQLWP